MVVAAAFCTRRSTVGLRVVVTVSELLLVGSTSAELAVETVVTLTKLFRNAGSTRAVIVIVAIASFAS